MNKENYFWKPLEISDARNAFVWSDTHFGHASPNWDVPLWKMRGFTSIEEHDEQLVQRWNDTVGVDSTIFHLGDIMFGMNGAERVRRVLERLNFKELYLMGGNHHAGFKDLISKSRSDGAISFDTFNMDTKVVYFLPNYFEVVANHKPFVLSHYPILSWNGQAKGSIMVFGHCHGSLKNSKLGAEYLATAKAEEVCVESHPKPVSFQELIDKFKTKQTVTFDHHDQHTQNPF